ncbi:SRPBCC family protein [Pelomonas sp. APW6]|uniref:SRPBCC family protein n=1 Tax=Roseateles subflavus TaxID=3053353 RepID=A0ABT7LHS0_9BURK|nr:SRPBCC family protein [Pelomonas sp. APW6]MDL5032405.1 SRPBCC family protein [Pelomonas sp. APW6]
MNDTPATDTPAAGTHTIHLQRVLRAPPERVYRAFLDASALAKWLPPHGFTAQIHELDARVGGRFRMSFTHFGSGHSHSFHGEYLELVPATLIRHTDQFDDPNLPGVLTVTIRLRAVFCGTELEVVQAGIPAVIPKEACLMGWQESLMLLAQLVEPEIPG